jgi:hypothetical protein
MYNSNFSDDGEDHEEDSWRYITNLINSSGGTPKDINHLLLRLASNIKEEIREAKSQINLRKKEIERKEQFIIRAEESMRILQGLDLIEELKKR